MDWLHPIRTKLRELHLSAARGELSDAELRAARIQLVQGLPPEDLASLNLQPEMLQPLQKDFPHPKPPPRNRKKSRISTPQPAPAQVEETDTLPSVTLTDGRPSASEAPTDSDIALPRPAGGPQATPKAALPTPGSPQASTDTVQHTAPGPSQKKPRAPAAPARSSPRPRQPGPAQSRSSTAATGAKPSQPPIQDRPSRPASQNKTDPPALQPEPSPLSSQQKPPESLAQPRPSPPALQGEPGASTVPEPSAGPDFQHAANQPVLQGKPSPPARQGKPSPPAAQSSSRTQPPAQKPKPKSSPQTTPSKFPFRKPTTPSRKPATQSRKRPLQTPRFATRVSQAERSDVFFLPRPARRWPLFFALPAVAFILVLGYSLFPAPQPYVSATPSPTRAAHSPTRTVPSPTHLASSPTPPQDRPPWFPVSPPSSPTQRPSPLQPPFPVATSTAPLIPATAPPTPPPPKTGLPSSKPSPIPTAPLAPSPTSTLVHSPTPSLPPDTPPPTNTPIPSPTRRPTEPPTPLPTRKPTEPPTPMPTHLPTQQALVRPTQPHTPKPTVKPSPKPPAAQPWQKLGFDDDTLRGWFASPRTSWSVQDGILRLQRGPTRVRVITDRGYRNFALSVQAQIDEASAIFGLILRAQGDERVILLEIQNGRPVLILGNRVEAVDFTWPPGGWHEIQVWARHQSLEVLIDGRKVADLKNVSIGGPGAIGVYCQAGVARFRDAKVQRFPD